jgi:TolB-like protein/class 3 adenylate cyclase/Tfp pilus assembly protein PilF
MSTEIKKEIQLEIAHVLFIDIVGYSKLSINDQHAAVEELNQIVRSSEQFQKAEAAGRLLKIPTGDGMALVFYASPEAPAQCAVEISRLLKEHSSPQLRMGIHSGPVSGIIDVNGRANLAGPGLNIAQRVMDCGDAKHILLSKHSAEDLEHFEKWQPYLHPLGDCQMKHGIIVSVVNLYTDHAGNRELPSKLKQAREQEAAVHRARVVRQRKRIGVIAAALLAILSGVAFWFFMRNASSNLLAKSIAVLPFENLGADKENAYLADGVQDDILTDLTKVADLKVISRRSVAQYRDTKQTIREIGQALQVGHILEGSVRKIAGRIHVTAQLIDTRTQRETWGEKYDRDIADVFQIQSDISQAIVTQLKAALSPAEKAAIEEKPTQDKEAYDLYLRARSLVYEFGLLSKTAEENATKAVTLLESAIARDPKFTLAYCVLGDAQLILNDTGNGWDKAPLIKAKEAIDAALRISPNSPEAHLILARYLINEIEDNSAGEKELSIAAAGLPGRVDVFNLRAEVEEQRGQWKEALRDREKASELDPRDGDTANDLANLYIDLRRYDNAERLLDHMIATTSQRSTSLFWRSKSEIAIARGDAKAAMAALDSSPNRKLGLWGLNHMAANVLVMERNYPKAEEILQTVEETAKTQNVLAKHGVSPWMRAVTLERLGRIARFRGEKEKARGYFEAARPLFEEWLTEGPEPSFWRDSHAPACIAEIDAALGRKEDAIREARNALAAWPLSRNAAVSPDLGTLLAIVYVWTGERDAALQQLTELVKLPSSATLYPSCPAGLTAGELKLNPLWDELRNDPRFDKIVAEAAKPIKLD